MEKNNELELKYKVLGFVFTIIILICFYFLVFGARKDTEQTSDIEGKPSNIELMSYAQTVLDDKMNSPRYSSDVKNYKFIETGLRYKIEGTVNDEKFFLILEFKNDKYKEYNVISLQVGNKTY